MILIPIGHEQTTVRRLPWVTFGVMAICAVAFVLSGRAQLFVEDDVKLGQRVQKAVEYYLEHPYLELDSDFRREIFPEALEQDFKEFLDQSKATHLRPKRKRTLELEQERLDRLSARALKSHREHPLMQWGLTPNRITAVTLLSHMFLHAGWLHLIGNMLILYLAGPFIEDVWGRPLYLAFFLVAGLVAALFHIGANAGSTIPMVGASGAIAGVMGAFLVREPTNLTKCGSMSILAL